MALSHSYLAWAENFSAPSYGIYIYMCVCVYKCKNMKNTSSSEYDFIYC